MRRRSTPSASKEPERPYNVCTSSNLTYHLLFNHSPGTFPNGEESVFASQSEMTGCFVTAETEAMKADGESLCYVNVELIDENGNAVPDADILLKAEVTGAAALLGFGSGNPITDENYSKGRFTSYQGKALAVLRAGCEAGEAKLTVSAKELGKAEITLPMEEV